jgi:uncharacterized protein YjbI with pentapeptide repeats
VTVTYQGYRLGPQELLQGAALAGLDFGELGVTSLAAARLDRADLTGADLTGVKLAGAVLDRARLVGARVRPDGGFAVSAVGADFKRAVIRRPADADLAGARLNRVRLETDLLVYGRTGSGEVVQMFKHAGLRTPGAFWRRFHAGGFFLRGWNARGARLRKMRLTQCDLEGSDFTGAYLVRCELVDCNVRYCKFDLAKQRGLRLVGCDTYGASFRGTDAYLNPSAGSGDVVEIEG